MAKIQIKKLDVLSVAKIYALIGVIVGFIIGIFVAIFASAFGALGSMGGLPGMGLATGFASVAAIIILPIIYGIMLFISGAIGAFIYNIIAGRVGGIVFES
jgi:hypothetical protein